MAIDTCGSVFSINVLLITRPWEVIIFGTGLTVWGLGTGVMKTCVMNTRCSQILAVEEVLKEKKRPIKEQKRPIKERGRVSPKTCVMNTRCSGDYMVSILDAMPPLNLKGTLPPLSHCRLPPPVASAATSATSAACLHRLCLTIRGRPGDVQRQRSPSLLDNDVLFRRTPSHIPLPARLNPSVPHIVSVQ